MTVEGMINLMVEKNPGMYKEDLKKIVALVLDGMREVIKRGDSLTLTGIGVVHPKFVEGQEVWKNPYTGRHEVLERRVVLAFRPYKKFQDYLTDRMAGEFSTESFGLDEGISV